MMHEAWDAEQQRACEDTSTERWPVRCIRLCKVGQASAIGSSPVSRRMLWHSKLRSWVRRDSDRNAASGTCEKELRNVENVKTLILSELLFLVLFKTGFAPVKRSLKFWYISLLA